MTSPPPLRYSGVTYSGSQVGATTFALTTTGGKAIGYLAPSHIHVYKSTAASPALVEQTRPGDWDFDNDGTSIVLKTGIVAGDIVTILRATPVDAQYTVFGKGALLTSDQLNKATIFNLYVNQETEDLTGEAVIDSSLALAQSTTALSQSTTALAKATDAMLAAGTAVSEVGQALDTANDAKAVAEGAAAISGSAIQKADNSLVQAATASSAATAAEAKATAALNAVVDAAIYVPVANVAAIPGTPAQGARVEVRDSTGIQNFTPLTGKPAGFIGEAALYARLSYAGSSWQWNSYGAVDPEARYLKGSVASTTAAGIVQLSNATNSTSQTFAATPAAVKAAYDEAVNASSAASSASASAGAALSRAGGTMTGAIVMHDSQQKATASAYGITILSSSTSSPSESAAATSFAVKNAFDLAYSANLTALAALPKNIASLPLLP